MIRPFAVPTADYDADQMAVLLASRKTFDANITAGNSNRGHQHISKAGCTAAGLLGEGAFGKVVLVKGPDGVSQACKIISKEMIIEELQVCNSCAEYTASPAFVCRLLVSQHNLCITCTT